VIDGHAADATVTYGEQGPRVVIDGAAVATDVRVFEAQGEAYVLRRGRQTHVRLKDVSAAAAEAGGGDGAVKAPMHGKVLEIFAAAGDAVQGGQRVAVIEAMKMEHTLRAPFAGTVANVAATVGAQVVEGARIMVIERAVD
jgi:3-methylcrotonyl-CoA carboxylase alpha subunit